MVMDYHMIELDGPAEWPENSASVANVRQDLFGLEAVLSSPIASLHGYARTNFYSVRRSWSNGVFDLGQGTHLRCNKHSLRLALLITLQAHSPLPTLGGGDHQRLMAT